MDLDIKTLQNQYWKQLTDELIENRQKCILPTIKQQNCTYLHESQLSKKYPGM